MQENRKVVVVADDNVNNRKLVSMLLQEHGYTVVQTVSGADCLSLLIRMRPSLIILDIMMPDMDGFETCRRIRHDSNLRQVPILFLTAYPFAENIQKALSVGGNDFIAKPFDIDVLLNRVATLMSAGTRPLSSAAKAARH